MKTYRIALIPGDGIGPEVLAEGVKVLKQIAQWDNHINFDFEEFPWGCDYYLREGRMMPSHGLEELKSFDSIFLGAVGSPHVPDHISLWDLLLTIRKEFDQYVNLRPVKLLRGAPCPLKDISREAIDMLFIRENTEGEYAGTGHWKYKNQKREVVIQNNVFSRKGCERIIRYAYEIARQENKSLTSISKANAMNYSMVFWDQIFREVGKEYPEVQTYSYLVDAAAMYMITDPGRFEIVVTTNLFGDILTDIGAAIAGGMGLAAGANLNPERAYPSMFEPIHGSAPNIAGKNIANPLATIWSVAQMMEFFGHPNWTQAILESIEELLIQGKHLPYDLGGNRKTFEVGNAFLQILETVRSKNLP
ncbi:MAG: isocitrate/isopropylmalate family dehydrogenase [Tissierellia bacterium]|nr:isocitrate/isopropylmalate family dehydrogenase [Tissierellia bacterium]